MREEYDFSKGKRGVYLRDLKDLIKEMSFIWLSLFSWLFLFSAIVMLTAIEEKFWPWNAGIPPVTSGISVFVLLPIAALGFFVSAAPASWGAALLWRSLMAVLQTVVAFFFILVWLFDQICLGCR
ncbi:hypothetical protein I4Q48_19485 [Leptospira interrogans]|uniref:Uncharacterized protein n=1 Tax=Leptospira interrogans str. UI 12758 TaxID=1049938 RepID=A0A0E2DLQ1_LEPIR|nr:hypothetical protein [Leptospira interrogans]EKR56565.1 hypothetical protein LEP1GSC105_4296 [Leptospira interrogans str. UI 12758]MBM2890594.1 hypothetical protein [Leptospira interrogans]